MRKILSLVLTSILVLGLIGCSGDKKVMVKDYTNDKNELNHKLDIYSYMNSFQDYLNYIAGEISLDDADLSLIAYNLIVSVEDNSNNDIIEGDGDNPSSAEEDYIPDPDELDDITEYPIVDERGNIIGYGSKEESDESFRVYNLIPYYSVEYCEGFYDKLLMKVYYKGVRKTFTYYLELDAEGKVFKYTVLRG